MSWHVGTATDWRNLADLLYYFCTLNRLASVAINAGGTGYTVGDILTVSGGTSQLTATLEVTAVAAGVITGVRVANSGAYSVNPTNPVSVTGGTGTGATFNLTFDSPGWTSKRATNVGGGAVEREIILDGSGSGSDHIYVGWRTYYDGGADASNWELAGFTGYNADLTWPNQPGKNPGEYDDPADDEDGCYVPLIGSNIPFWFSVTSRRIIMVAKASSAYMSAYLGFINPFMTAAEYPYPLAVIGTTSIPNRRYSDSGPHTSSIIDPVAQTITSTEQGGPGYLRKQSGVWSSIHNATGIPPAAFRAQLDINVWPCSALNPTFADLADNWGVFTPSTYSLFYKMIPQSLGTSPTDVLIQTEDSGGDITPLFPATLFDSLSTEQQLLGELDNVVWLSTAGGLTTEDRIIQGTDRWRVFQSGTRTDQYAHFAVKEA